MGSLIMAKYSIVEIAFRERNSLVIYFLWVNCASADN